MFHKLLLIISSLYQLNKSQTITNLTLTVYTNVVINKIPEMYFGFTMDWWKPSDQSGKWGDASILWLNLSNPILINLTKALTPAMLRLGGSPEDSIVYNMSGMCLTSNSEEYGCAQSGKNYGCLNESRWQQILKFIDNTQLSLLFGLNACFGRPNRSSLMNYTNIEQLLNFTIQQYKNNFVTTPIYAFELGNEIQWSIAGDIYAQDFANIQSILNTYWTNAKLSNIPYMVGPDAQQTTQGWEWNSQILSTLDDISHDNISSIQRALTYHHYPNCGSPNGNISVFNLGCLSSIEFMAINYTTMLADQYNVDVWMGEGSEHSGGGVLNLTNVFVSSFYYLYQLCELATYGVKGSMRSDLVGGYYELINHTTSIPTPDYWMLYMWRQFIGDTLYNSSLTFSNDSITQPWNYSNELKDEWKWNLSKDDILDEVKNMYNAAQETYVRGYSFSYKNNSDEYMIILLNYHLWNIGMVNISIINNNNIIYDYDEYHIVGIGADGIKTKTIQVNGVTLTYENGQFPNIKPISGNGIVEMAPKTITFVHMFIKKTNNFSP
eukprot:9111_1